MCRAGGTLCNLRFGGSGEGRAAMFFYREEWLAVAVLTNLQGAGSEALVELVATANRQHFPAR